MYKTMTLELIRQEYPALHERLRSARTLLSTVELQAAALKRHHEDWMDRIAQSRPDSEPIQIASEALELALQELREELSPCGSAPSDGPTEPLSLDAAMAFIRRTTPTA